MFRLFIVFGANSVKCSGSTDDVALVEVSITAGEALLPSALCLRHRLLTSFFRATFVPKPLPEHLIIGPDFFETQVLMGLEQSTCTIYCGSKQHGIRSS
jgi:hypothetical protein